MILPAFLSLFLLAAGNQPAIASTPGGAAPGPASHGYDHDDGHEQMLGFGPGLESARANGRAIFNAVHDAMRQFGSSWHHNGMSVFPAVVPRGVLLYHGSHSPDVPRSHEWLAFEVEHAENFARSRPPRRRGGWHSSDDTSLKHEDPLDVAVRLQSRDWLNDEGEGDEVLPGYLHTYRTTRPLNLLYIDGMAAANTWYGTTDTQDLLLTYAPDRQPMEDYRRGGDLCEAFAAWGVEGFIRMEPGFEVIFCDFSPDAGLELASAPARQALPDDPAYADFDSALSHFEWVRAAAQRYRDIGAGRVLLDFSGMVSAYFYPVNLTNPDPERPELPRLVQATEAQLAVMRGHVAGVASRRGLGDGSEDVVDWQGVTDSESLGIIAALQEELSSRCQSVNHNVHRLIRCSDRCAVCRPASVPGGHGLSRSHEEGDRVSPEPPHGLLRGRRPRTQGREEALRAALPTNRHSEDLRGRINFCGDREHNGGDLRVALHGAGASPRARLLENIGRRGSRGRAARDRRA